ncbi:MULTISPECIES: B12-binding domain-containing radical SAM protein [Geobacter]|uniref:B12-binding domain-containing radical SAM protein n=1 Tax=Geobacter TaxID=28231 RepID=UPI00257477FC|nr:B12-binding domain-containing radical SAM protein [Geobacter sulfurreducens]BEH09423.1 B12-binding domain-containing radical SAM protein [Geobacter sulfurreducens subsp. ethanolicus]BET57305.1 B12-binding domain-containing radical SAM protein [Geobacter sp. 60473]
MKILLVYPHYPDTFWSFRHALKFIDRKASFPPLGLLTVAAMLPGEWEMRLVDMNVRPLDDADLKWADYVFISAMTIQLKSTQQVIARCRQHGVKTVAGGPLFTACHDDFPDVDHLVLGEAELTLPPFLTDLCHGTARHLYTDDRWADLRSTPIPLWELIDVRNYAAMNIQYCRGCPFDCEFCDITALFGRKPRSKPLVQLIAELDSLYSRGWRGAVFFVDDNFIGDKGKLKREVLPAIIDWMEQRKHPFYFYTEASIDLADDPRLMELMVKAGFEEVFIGIETPYEESHAESGKVQNKNRDLLASVKSIQQAGLQVHGGFIVGFDSDPPSIFERQIRFIQESGIVTAMVGILSAIRGTKLHERMSLEGRLLGDDTGNNMDSNLNFIPRMEVNDLIGGYRSILDSIYAPKNYYQRVIRLFKEYRPQHLGKFHLQRGYIGALFKSILFLGVIGRERIHFWKLFFWSLVRKPRLFPLAITYAIYGFHFRKVAEKFKASGMFDGEGVWEKKDGYA